MCCNAPTSTLCIIDSLIPYYIIIIIMYTYNLLINFLLLLRIHDNICLRILYSKNECFRWKRLYFYLTNFFLEKPPSTSNRGSTFVRYRIYLRVIYVVYFLIFLRRDLC